MLAVLPDWTLPITSPLIGSMLRVSELNRRRSFRVARSISPTVDSAKPLAKRRPLYSCQHVFGLSGISTKLLLVPSITKACPLCASSSIMDFSISSCCLTNSRHVSGLIFGQPSSSSLVERKSSSGEDVGWDAISSQDFPFLCFRVIHLRASSYLRDTRSDLLTWSNRFKSVLLI